MNTSPSPLVSTVPDGLTALLDTLSLRGVALYRGRFATPWSVSFERDTGDGTCSRDWNEPANATFHMILSGAPCVLRTPGGAAIPVCPGDFVLLPHADPRTLASDARTPATPLECALTRGTITADGWFCYGGNGAITETLCGDFYFAGELRGMPKTLTHPLLATLPPVIILRGENNSPQPWLAVMLDAMRCETTGDRPGHHWRRRGRIGRLIRSCGHHLRVPGTPSSGDFEVSTMVAPTHRAQSTWHWPVPFCDDPSVGLPRP